VLHLSVAEGVHRIEDAYTNWYVVQDDGALRVVDTGHPRSWSSLQDLLRHLGHAGGAIEAVVLTHAHFDHAGFAERARTELGVPVYAAMAAMGALWTKGVEHVRTYVDGEVLDVPGRPRVLFAPGHTHGHSALHIPERGVLIAGDAVVTYDPYVASEGPQIVAGAATADSDEALRSLDAIAAVDADVVLTGHGAPWTQGTNLAVERARAAGPH
jgi:glyoxylase-like metal-dependent hydrolase (beta-lactamase superfamily II)